MFRIARVVRAEEALPFRLATFTPHELTRVVLRAVRENRSDIALWKAVISRTSKICDTMQPGDLSVVVYGLGKMRFRDRPLMDRVAAAVIPNLGAMALKDISHLLAGFARLEVRNDLLFDLASREIGRLLPTCKSLSDIANITLAYTQLHYEHPLLFEALGKRTVFLLPFDDSGAEIPKLVEAFGRTDIDNAKLFALLSSEICKRVDSIPVSSLARIANSYNKRGLLKQHVFLSEQILDESFRRRHDFDPVSTALLLNAVSKLKNAKTGLLFDYFVADLGKRGVAKFDLHSVTLLAHAVGKYSALTQLPEKQVEKLFQLIGDRVAALAAELTGKQIAYLVKAFAAVGARHGPLLFNIPRHVQASVAGMNLSEIAAVMHGYARLGIRNDILLDSTPPRILTLLEQGVMDNQKLVSGDEIFALSVTGDESRNAWGRTKALVDLLESFAMLMVNDRKLLPRLLIEIDRNRDSITDTDALITIPRTLNMLQLECPEGLASMISARIKNSVLEDAQRHEIEVLLSTSHSPLLTRY